MPTNLLNLRMRGHWVPTLRKMDMNQFDVVAAAVGIGNV